MDSQYVTCRISEDDLTKQKIFNPKKASFRYLGLTLISALCFGMYFCYDNPGSLQDKFETDLDMPARGFMILYSVYSWPNVILCFVGGFLLDNVFGIRLGTVIYSILTLCGQLLFATGTYVNMFWLMVLGRFVFGIGAESLNVAQTSYTTIWFKGKALNTLLALQLSLSQVGSGMNSLIMGNIYKFVSETLTYSGPECIGIVLFIGSIACVGSMVCALLLIFMDNHAEKVFNRNTGEKIESVKIADAKDFPLTFWLVVLVCAAYYVTIYPFLSVAKSYIMKRYELEPDIVNAMISLFYGTSIFACPLFGILNDKTERNTVWIVISIFGTLLAHGLFAFTYINPYACMVVLGISHSLFSSSIWPVVAFLTSESQLGTAYGITLALLNLYQAVMSILCGVIIDNYGYFMLELFFVVWLLITLIPAIMIWIINSNSTGKTSRFVKEATPSFNLVEDGLNLQSNA